MASAPEPGGEQIGDCRLDHPNRALTGPAGRVELSPIASRFLSLLFDNAGAIVERDRFVDELWAGNHLVAERALRRVASESRRAMTDAGVRGAMLETVYGRGYRLAPTIGQRPTLQGPERPRFEWRGFAAAVFLIILTTACLAWILSLAIGLVWSIRGD